MSGLERAGLTIALSVYKRIRSEKRRRLPDGGLTRCYGALNKLLLAHLSFHSNKEAKQHLPEDLDQLEGVIK